MIAPGCPTNSEGAAALLDHPECSQVEIQHRFFFLALGLVLLAQTNDRAHGLGVEACALGLGEDFLDVVPFKHSPKFDNLSR
jgi:hypothetical protein